MKAKKIELTPSKPQAFIRTYEKSETLIPSSGIGKTPSHPTDARKQA